MHIIDTRLSSGAATVRPHGADLTPIAVRIPVACQMTGLCRSSLYSEIKAGRIAARKAGARTLVLVESLRAYIDALPSVGEAA